MPFNIPNTRFVFVSNTEAAPEEDCSGSDRSLTENGLAQATALEQKLITTAFDLALFPQIRRAIQTYGIITNGLEPKNAVWMASLYERLVDVELVARGIEEEVAQYHNGKVFDVLVIICHPSVNKIISAMFPTLVDEMRNFTFGECGAVRVVVDSGGTATLEVVN